MSDKIHRDDLIREKLRNFEKNPPPELWEGIRNGISSKKRRMVPLFYRYAAGVILLLGIATLIRFLVVSESPSDQIATSRQNTESAAGIEAITEPVLAESSTENKIIPKGQASEQESVIASISSTIDPSSKKPIPGDYVKSSESSILPEPTLTQKMVQEQEYIASSDEADIRFPKQLIPYNPEKPMIHRLTLEKTYSWNDLIPEEPVASEEDKLKIFSLGAVVSPIYSYRDIAGVSPSLNEYFNESESGILSYSGGLNFGIKAGKKISIHAGLMYSRLGVSVNNILAVAELRELGSDQIRFEPDASSAYLVSNSIGSIQNGEIREKAGMDYSSVSPASPSSTLSTSVNYLNSGGFYAPADNYVQDEGSIDQLLHYLEVPLLFRYKLVDGQLDIGLLGGMSSNFLVGNRVIYRREGSSEIIGTTSGIQRVNYSGNFGVGLNYDFNRQFRFLFEPQLKYYLNSINEDNLIINRPYSVGLYTGFIYLF